MSEILVKIAEDSANRQELTEALKDAPEPKNNFKDYTETEIRLVEMLQECTGAHYLDSGSLYGRQWQSNRKVKDFKNRESMIVEIHAPHYYKDNNGKKRKMPAEIDLYYDMFHYLNNFLTLTEEAKVLQKMFMDFAELPENREKSWNTLIDAFTQFIVDFEQDSDRGELSSTYNYDNILHGIIMYGTVEIGEHAFILLQIHNGCDVRGGYTNPQIFAVSEIDYFHIAQTELRAACTCGYCDMESNESGYSWTDINGNEIKRPLNRMKFVKNPDKKAYGKDSVFCKKCGEPVKFGVLEDY